jgi:hypothetical protein
MRLFGLLLLLCGSIGALAQDMPAIESYMSDDGAFGFAYPDTYGLLVGDGIYKRTQGKHVGVSVCDSRTALACVLYPMERFQDTNFEAAAFSINRIPSVANEGDCLGYADRADPQSAQSVSASTVNIMGRDYRHVTTATKIQGHSQSAQRYRTFLKDACYELRVAISLSAVAGGESETEKEFNSSNSESVSGALSRVLSTFAFNQDTQVTGSR